VADLHYVDGRTGGSLKEVEARSLGENRLIREDGACNVSELIKLIDYFSVGLYWTRHPSCNRETANPRPFDA